MKIFLAMKSAALRTMRTWKGVLIIWFVSLVLVSLVALPMKGILKSALGSSMITEKLSEGFNLEIFTDLGTAFKSLTAAFSSGLILLVFVSILINAFLTGGLFCNLKGSAGKFSVGEFYRASAKNFWSFLIISLIISLILFLLALVIIVIPMAIVGQTESPSEGIMFRTGLITFLIFFVLLVIILLVADYARAWQVSNEKSRCFSAIGFGFKQTFTRFLSSWPLMLLILFIQVLFGWFVLKLIPSITPASGTGVFLFFLLSQLMFIIRVLLKTWRYGSVTALMEINNQPSVHL
jgi:hypothetical protein